MAQIFHFENDLFFINEEITVLSHIFDLEIDESYFFDKIIEDILFIDSVIGKLSIQLKENPRTIKLEATYRNLFLTQKRYIAFIKKVIDSVETINLPIKPFIDKLEHILSQQQSDNETITEIIDATEEKDSPDLVSQQEYQFLFNDSEEDEL